MPTLRNIKRNVLFAHRYHPNNAASAVALNTGSGVGVAGITKRRVRDVWIGHRRRAAEVVGITNQTKT